MNIYKMQSGFISTYLPAYWGKIAGYPFVPCLEWVEDDSID